MKKIAVYGAGGFGREVKMLIDQINNQNKKYEFIGYFDDGIDEGKIVNDYPVLGNIEAVNEWDTSLGIVFAIGNPKIKKETIAKLNNPNLFFPTLIHPNVFIGKDYVSIGEGSIICAGNILTTNIDIGKHVIINLSCTIGHDTKIGDFSSFMPGINISGEVVIHPGVYGGTGAKIINQVEIGEYTVIGAGAVVTKNLPDHCTAVGIPAKPLK